MRRLGLGLVLVVFATASSPVLATVTAPYAADEYSPSEDTTSFTVNFPFLLASQLVVTKTTEATGTEDVLALGVDYTVTLPVGSTEGTVTTLASVTSDYSLRIERSTSVTQDTRFRTQGTFRPANHEDALDKLTMILQEQGAGGGSSDEDCVGSISVTSSLDFAALNVSCEDLPITVTGAATDMACAVSAPMTNLAQSTEIMIMCYVSGGNTVRVRACQIDSSAGSVNPQAQDFTVRVFDEDCDAGSAAVNLHEADSDPHTAYWKLLGRSSGQVGFGGTAAGGDAQIVSTYHATKGLVKLGSNGTELVVDDATNYVGIGTATPSSVLDVVGASEFAGDMTVTGNVIATTDVYADDVRASDDVIVSDDITAESASLTGDLTVNSEIFGGASPGNDLRLVSTSDSAHDGLITLGYSGTELVVDDDSNYVGIGTSSPNVTLDVRGQSVMRRRMIVVGTSPYDVNSLGQECGAVFVANDKIEYDLPLLSASGTYMDGCEMTFINANTSVGDEIFLDPASADIIIGTCDTVEIVGGAGKYVTDAADAAARGNSITVVAVYTGADAPAWYITDCTGDWAVEP